MLRHSGEQRTHQHNLNLASLLAFVAGMVNVAGFLSIHELTTNVTGHLAHLLNELFEFKSKQAFAYFLYLIFFLAGSFTAGFIVELTHRKLNKYEYIIPVLLEGVLLLISAGLGTFLVAKHPNVLALILLFTMGLQNSLVTSISKAVVRTTHLTGLFTDLGIELSKLFFKSEYEHRNKLISSIYLRLIIIGSFFLGGIASGILFNYINTGVLYIISFVLFAGVAVDLFLNRKSNK